MISWEQHPLIPLALVTASRTQQTANEANTLQRTLQKAKQGSPYSWESSSI